ncbi:MAG: VCBS repeat-containing protein [Pseudomonadota bacterium]
MFNKFRDINKLNKLGLNWVIILLIYLFIGAGCYTGIEGAFETNGLTGPGETQVRTLLLTGPSKAACLQAIVYDSNNTFGIIGGNMNDIVLPECTVAYSDGAVFEGTVTYSLTGLPDGLSFDETTRTISLTGAPDFSQRIELTYSCTATTPDESLALLVLSKASVTLEAPIVFYLNDYDEDGLVDYTEYVNSDGILLHKSGWFKVNLDNRDQYCVGTVFCDIPNGITVNGFDFTDPTDAIGDFDGDGSLNEEELTNGTNPYVAADSDETWTTAEYNYANRKGDYIVSADLDNDGDHDLIVGDNTNGGILTMINQGNGTMAAPVWLGFGTTLRGLTAGDFNQDGLEDVAVALFTSARILISDGDGTYTVQPVININNGKEATAADFNNDGILDLAIVDDNSTNFMLNLKIGQGNGTISSAIITTLDTSAVGVTFPNIAFGDLNQDGNMDLVIPKRTDVGYLHILLGNGDGTFEVSSIATSVASESTPFPAPARPGNVGIADFDADGYLDIFVPMDYFPPMSDVRAWIYRVYYGDGQGNFEEYTTTSLSGATLALASPDDLVLADFDGDNDLDVAVVMGGFNLNTYILTNDGSNEDQAFNNVTSIANNTTAPISVVAVDLDEDGKIDIANASENAANIEIEVILND